MLGYTCKLKIVSIKERNFTSFVTRFVVQNQLTAVIGLIAFIYILIETSGIWD